MNCGLNLSLKSLILLLMVFAGAVTASAQTPNQLEVQVTELEDFDENPIRLERLQIDGSHAGNVANFTVTAIIGNVGYDEIEGELILPLPSGAVINDYALDIEGRLVDGVLTEKERARKAYTDKVTEGIDPGIAEKLADNRYRTRIYPIEEDSRRTVRLGFAVPLAAGESWVLESNVAADHLIVNARDFGVRTDERNLAANFSFDLSADAKPVQSSRIRHPVAGDFALVALTEAQRSEINYSRPASIKNLAIIWDNSLSRQDDDLVAERNLLDTLAKSLAPESIELIIGNDKVRHRKSYDGPQLSQLRADIVAKDNDGGTRIPSLFPSDLSADLCLLFSDGNSMSTGAFETPDCPVIAISGADDANIGFLSALGTRTGGQYLPLRQAQLQGLPGTLNPALSSDDLINPRWLGSPQDGLIMGRLEKPSTRSVSIKVGTQKFRHRLKSKDTHKGVPTLWANLEAENLRANGASVSDVIDFSRPFSIAGPESTLIVLEDPDDYVEAKIKPPVTYPEDLMEEYEEYWADYEEEMAEERTDRVDEIWDVAEEISDWYAEIFEYDPEEAKEAEPMPAPSVQSNAPPPPPSPQVVVTGTVETHNDFASSGGADDEDEIIVTGANRTPTTAQVLPRVWTPDRPYLKAMERASASRLETVYREQRKEYGNLPAFYFESADLFHRKGQSERAAQIVQGAMELPSANVQTYTQTAHRLLSYGDYDRAIEIYAFVKDLSPDLPQVSYNLAVALHDRGLYLQRQGNSKAAQKDYNAALAHLEHVLREPWNDDYEGVEVVALIEANAIYQKLPRAERRKSPYAKLLKKPVQMDLRIVVDWNTDYTDLDLWVKEPTGEDAYYGNSETNIGGFMSNDMTDGYGPEQYLLADAPGGEYEISVKYFSNSEYNPNGPVSLRARITKFFGSPDQETQTIIIELSEEKEEEIVGEFVVE